LSAAVYRDYIASKTLPSFDDVLGLPRPAN
jgi:hypothetical protein